MANTKTVSFGSLVPENQADQLDLQRRQMIADLLRKQATAPIEQQQVSGRVVPISPLEGLSKIGQSFVAGQMDRDNEEKQQEIVSKQRKLLSDQFDQLMTATTPRPATPEQNLGQGDSRRQMAYMEHTDTPAPDIVKPAEAAYNPTDTEMTAAIVKYLNNTGNNSKAAEYVVSEARNKKIANLIRGQDSGTSNSDALQVSTSPQPAPGAATTALGSTTPETSAPVPGTSQGAYQLLDPAQKNIVQSYLAAGKAEDAIKYMGDVLKPQMSSDGKTFVYRNGKSSVVPGSLEAYGQFKKEEKQYDAPIVLKTETGAEVQLSPVEWASYQKTGQLPVRFLPPNMRDGLQAEADASGTPGSVNIRTPQGTVGGEIAPRLGVSQTPQQKAFDDKMGAEGATRLLDGRDAAKALSDSIYTIHKSRDLINSGVILGAGADLKTDAAKVLSSLGFDISPDQVANTDFLRSTLGEGLLKNAKKLGVNPTDADARRLDVIVGTINKDPKALPMLLDWQEEMARKAIGQHNDLAAGARGPYRLTVDLPPAYKVKPVQPGGGKSAAATPSRPAAKKYNPATGRIE